MDSTQTYYIINADAFTEATLDLDMTKLHQRFANYLPPHASVLDLGSGPGRDSKVFKEMGYQVLAIDACETFVEHTRSYAGVEAVCLRFEDLAYLERFDGIWASASLLHVKRENLPAILNRLKQALKQDGVVYASFKHGEFTGNRNGRFFCDWTLDAFTHMLKHSTSFEICDFWESQDMRGADHPEWLNLILK